MISVGEQAFPCYIIFKGEGNIKEAERAYYSTLRGVCVAFQRKVRSVHLFFYLQYIVNNLHLYVIMFLGMGGFSVLPQVAHRFR